MPRRAIGSRYRIAAQTSLSESAGKADFAIVLSFMPVVTSLAMRR